jgi:hypothetical protein
MKNKTPKGKALAVIGAWMQIAPVLIFAIGMMTQLAGVQSDGFSFIFRAYLLGVAMSISGTIMLIISLVFMKYRAEWFFWFMLLFAGYLIFRISIVSCPIGIGIVLYLLSKKNEFKNKSDDLLKAKAVQ